VLHILALFVSETACFTAVFEISNHAVAEEQERLQHFDRVHDLLSLKMSVIISLYLPSSKTRAAYEH